MGVDPGYGRLGLAVLERTEGKETLLFSCCVETPPHEPFTARLVRLLRATEEAIVQWQPEALVVENLFVTKNQKTAMRVSEVRGGIIALAALRDMPVHELTPQEIKVAVTGDGSCDKRQVMWMVPRLVALPHTPRWDDEYDAIAAALAFFATNQTGRWRK